MHRVTQPLQTLAGGGNGVKQYFARTVARQGCILPKQWLEPLPWQLDNGVHLGLNHIVYLKVVTIKESTYLQALFLNKR